jgi:hypothetical protein
MIFQTLQILLLSLIWFDLEEDWDYNILNTLSMLVYMENPWNFRDENWFNNARFADDQIAENCYNCQGAQWTGEGEDLHSDGLPNFQMRNTHIA